MEIGTIQVAQVVPWLVARAGGTSNIVVNLSYALENAGVNTRIYTTDISLPAQASGLSRGVDSSDLPARALELRVEMSRVDRPLRFVYSRRLREALRRDMIDTDVVHIHSLFLYPQYAAFRAAEATARPWIVSPRGALDPYLRSRGRLRKAVTERLWQRRMLDGAAALHLTSQAESDSIADLGYRAPHVVVPNGLHVRDFVREVSYRDLRRRWVGDDGLLLMSHGRVTEKKGLDILIRALASVRKALPSAKLVLVGPDDEGVGASLLELSARMGVQDGVILSGPLYGDDLLSAIESCDLWVLPSHGENFGTAVVEAMARGKAVVTSPYVNIAQEAADEDALQVVNNTVDELAPTLIRLLDSEERRRQLGRNAASYVWRYDWANVALEYRQMYQQAIQNHGRFN